MISLWKQLSVPADPRPLPAQTLIHSAMKPRQVCCYSDATVMLQSTAIAHYNVWPSSQHDVSYCSRLLPSKRYRGSVLFPTFVCWHNSLYQQLFTLSFIRHGSSYHRWTPVEVKTRRWWLKYHSEESGHWSSAFPFQQMHKNVYAVSSVDGWEVKIVLMIST